MRRMMILLATLVGLIVMGMVATADMMTIRLDAWHMGHCPVCGEIDYSTTYGGYAPIHPVSFSDPLPAGSTVQRLTIETFGHKCDSSVSYTWDLNGATVASGSDPGPPGCACGTCYPHEYVTSFYPGGIPSWNAGGTNTLTPAVVGQYSLAYVELTIEYISDTTPPTIHGCPGDIEVDAAPGAPDAQVWWTEPTATDDLSGVASFTSTHLPGERFPLGITLVTYVATDGVGNTSTCSFLIIVHQRLDVVPPLNTMRFLGRGWEQAAGGGGGLEDPPLIGELPVSTVYEVGEPIAGCCSVVDCFGTCVEVPNITMTLYAVEIGEEFDVREALDARLLSCDEELCFCFSFSTWDLAPGYYDIRLGLPFMDHEWIRVELIAPEA